MFNVNLFVINESFWQPFRLQIFFYPYPGRYPGLLQLEPSRLIKRANQENKLALKGRCLISANLHDWLLQLEPFRLIKRANQENKLALKGRCLISANLHDWLLQLEPFRLRLIYLSCIISEIGPPCLCRQNTNTLPTGS